MHCLFAAPSQKNIVHKKPRVRHEICILHPTMYTPLDEHMSTNIECILSILTWFNPIWFTSAFSEEVGEG